MMAITPKRSTSGARPTKIMERKKTKMIEEKFHNGSYIYPEPPMVIEPGTFQGTAQELAQLILKQVENYPENFNMGGWVDGYQVRRDLGESSQKARFIKLKELDQSTACGTKMCIAGYAQMFVDGYVDTEVSRRAAALLGMEDGTQLFFVSDDAAREILGKLAAGEAVSEEDIYDTAHKFRD